jgi:hypothetical protein
MRYENWDKQQQNIEENTIREEGRASGESCVAGQGRDEDRDGSWPFEGEREVGDVMDGQS